MGGFYIDRFHGIERKTYELEVVTPMFLGGADPKDAELRVPPIKGMLRFWWRATCGITDISEMIKQEDKIFGSTEAKASFSISVETNDEIKPLLEFNQYKNKAEKFKVHNNDVNILDYLSYGTYEYVKGKGNEYNKKHIKPETKFIIKFCFYDSTYKDEVINAFRYFLSFGGVGAKNRNGFGSIYCKDFDNISDINKEFADWSLRDYTAFSSKSKVFKFKEHDVWEKAISEIGLIYRESRTFVEKHYSYNKRSLVSAPLTVNKQNKASEERHSKPYFLKVQKLTNGKFFGIIIYIPYQYHVQNKINEYISVCDSINKKIEELREKLK